MRIQFGLPHQSHTRAPPDACLPLTKLGTRMLLPFLLSGKFVSNRYAQLQLLQPQTSDYRPCNKQKKNKKKIKPIKARKHAKNKLHEHQCVCMCITFGSSIWWKRRSGIRPTTRERRLLRE
jgi:hypothetical protein